MSDAVVSSACRTRSLRDPEVVEELQRLRQTDNWRNLLYLARTWLYLLAVIGGTVAFYSLTASHGGSAWWNVPVTLLAIVLIGAGQHQLTALAHEASHHTLLRNRYLNDLVSDWFCMFPMFSSTQHYRLQHMAHHQFVNDPQRDPDVSQLQTSGHWLDFPLSQGEFLKTLVRQLWIPNLIRYIGARAKYNSIGTDANPYVKTGARQPKAAVRVGLAYIVGLAATLATFVQVGNAWLLVIVPVAAWLAAMVFYGVIPDDWYKQSRVHPVISARQMSLMRITFITALLCGIAWGTHLTGAPVGLYFLLLWVVPILTSFSFFMILRQLVQHGNADRGRLTNTRTFFVHPLLQFAVFPLGQNYHLPHHMFATVPHYRLKRLHEFLSRYPEYQEEGVVVEGYLWPPRKKSSPAQMAASEEGAQRNPTVIEVVGPEYHTKDGNPIYIDHSVLEQAELDEPEPVRAAS